MELKDRDDLEEKMLAAVLALWLAQRRVFRDEPEFWEEKEREDRELLLYWLGLLFVRSAVQHGLTEEPATAAARVWGIGHAVLVISRMRRHSQTLLQGSDPEETIFGENRARRFVVTEVTQAQAAGGEYAKQQLGEWSGEDLWFAANPAERRCPYCGKLHLQPRRLWKEIYYSKILPANPELEIYGEPERTGIHPNCNCFILYRGESSDDLNTNAA